MHFAVYSAALGIVLLGVSVSCPSCLYLQIFCIFLLLITLLGVFTALWINIKLGSSHKTTVTAEVTIKQLEIFRNKLIVSMSNINPSLKMTQFTSRKTMRRISSPNRCNKPICRRFSVAQWTVYCSRCWTSSYATISWSIWTITRTKAKIWCATSSNHCVHIENVDYDAFLVAERTCGALYRSSTKN